MWRLVRVASFQHFNVAQPPELNLPFSQGLSAAQNMTQWYRATLWRIRNQLNRALGPTHHQTRWLVLLVAMSVGLIYLSQCISSGGPLLERVMNGPPQGGLLTGGAWTRAHVESGQIFRLITASYAHASLTHLGLNLFWWVLLASIVSPRLGPARTFSLLVLGGLCGHLVSYLSGQLGSVGLSAAIYALIGALAVSAWKHHQTYRGQDDRKGVSRWLVVTVLVLLIMPFSLERSDHWAHMGGLAAGLGIQSLPKRPRLQQAMVIVSILVLATGAISSSYSPPTLALSQLRLEEPLPKRFVLAHNAELLVVSEQTTRLTKRYPELDSHLPAPGRCHSVTLADETLLLVRPEVNRMLVLATSPQSWSRYAPLRRQIRGDRCPDN